MSSARVLAVHCLVFLSPPTTKAVGVRTCSDGGCSATEDTMRRSFKICGVHPSILQCSNCNKESAADHIPCRAPFRLHITRSIFLSEGTSLKPFKKDRERDVARYMATVLKVGGTAEEVSSESKWLEDAFSTSVCCCFVARLSSQVDRSSLYSRHNRAYLFDQPRPNRQQQTSTIYEPTFALAEKKVTKGRGSRSDPPQRPPVFFCFFFLVEETIRTRVRKTVEYRRSLHPPPDFCRLRLAHGL